MASPPIFLKRVLIIASIKFDFGFSAVRTRRRRSFFASSNNFVACSPYPPFENLSMPTSVAPTLYPKLWTISFAWACASPKQKPGLSTFAALSTGFMAFIFWAMRVPKSVTWQRSIPSNVASACCSHACCVFFFASFTAAADCISLWFFRYLGLAPFGCQLLRYVALFLFPQPPAVFFPSAASVRSRKHLHLCSPPWAFLLAAVRLRTTPLIEVCAAGSRVVLFLRSIQYKELLGRATRAGCVGTLSFLAVGQLCFPIRQSWCLGVRPVVSFCTAGANPQPGGLKAKTLPSCSAATFKEKRVWCGLPSPPDFECRSTSTSLPFRRIRSLLLKISAPWFS